MFKTSYRNILGEHRGLRGEVPERVCEGYAQECCDYEMWYFRELQPGGEGGQCLERGAAQRQDPVVHE